MQQLQDWDVEANYLDEKGLLAYMADIQLNGADGGRPADEGGNSNSGKENKFEIPDDRIAPINNQNNNRLGGLSVGPRDRDKQGGPNPDDQDKQGFMS